MPRIRIKCNVDAYTCIVIKQEGVGLWLNPPHFYFLNPACTERRLREGEYRWTFEREGCCTTIQTRVVQWRGMEYSPIWLIAIGQHTPPPQGDYNANCTNRSTAPQQRVTPQHSQSYVTSTQRLGTITTLSLWKTNESR